MIFSLYFFALDVWGTVSDWIMVIVTTFTALYLYKTLKSQQEVQNTQNKLFEIESIRFRESIKPILNYKISKIEFKPGEKEKRIATIEVTNESEGIALKISSDFTDYTSKQVFIPIDFSSNRNHLKKGDKPILLHFLVEKGVSFVIFELTYEDVAETKYKQRVFCVHDSHGTEINPSLPEIIK